MDVESGAAKPTDEQVCAALATGNIEAMAMVYDAYADRLFGYALGVTGNRFAPLEAAGEVADVATDPVAGVAADDARHLIESAFEGMNESDREVIELALRHELSPTQISEIIGVSPNNASARLSAAKVQLERAVGALLLLRRRFRAPVAQADRSTRRAMPAMRCDSQAGGSHCRPGDPAGDRGTGLASGWFPGRNIRCRRRVQPHRGRTADGFGLRGAEGSNNRVGPGRALGRSCGASVVGGRPGSALGRAG